MSGIVKVKVIVLEDERIVGEKTISYYDGQDYAVKIDTPDGVDAVIPRKAGAE